MIAKELYQLDGIDFLLNFSALLITKKRSTMASYVQRALDSIPEFKQRYEKFLRLLRIGQYAKGTIENYCSKIARVGLFYGKHVYPCPGRFPVLLLPDGL